GWGGGLGVHSCVFELSHCHGVGPWPGTGEPALRLARDCFPVSQRLHDAVEWERDLLARFPETAAVWLPGGKPPEPGSVMRLPELAATLVAYSERGRSEERRVGKEGRCGRGRAE